MVKTYNVLLEWFKRTDSLGYLISTWCNKVNDKEVLCKICDKNFYCGRKGFAALSQHVVTSIHKENAVLKLNDRQLQLKHAISKKPEQNASASLQLFNSKEVVTKAEIIWAMKCVQSHISASANDDIKCVFNVMFPGPVSEQFCLGRTKFSYLITEAIGPYFKEKLLVDVRKSYFSLLYDETTNNGDKKELQFGLRYWSEDQNEVVSKHLKTVFIGHATADDIVCKIFDTLNDAGLSSNKLLMLGSDGPNVNKKVWNLVNTRLIEERDYGLIDIGTCYLHVIHNAFLKGLEEFGDTACELICSLYNFFKKYPSRWEDFENCQRKKNVIKHRFIKHTSTRWLTLGPAAERVLEQWLAVEDYFLNFVPNKEKRLMQTEKYKLIVKVIRYISIKTELCFVVDSAQLYCHFSELFQRSEPLIHILYTEIDSLMKKIAGRVCKPECMPVNYPIAAEHLLKPLKIDCGEKTTQFLNDLREVDKPIVLHKIQKHYVASFNYLANKIASEKKNTLSHFQYLKIDKIKDSKSVFAIGEICKLFSFLGIDRLTAKDEWRILQTDPDQDVQERAGVRIDHFWRNILSLQSDVGHLKYPSLNKIVKACLSISHGNSDIERGFSVSRQILSADKSCLSERVLDDRLIIKDYLKHFSNVGEVPITKDLLKLAYGARRSYELYLEEEKKLKDQQLKAEKEKEEKAKEEKLREERLVDVKESVKRLEEKAKFISLEKKEVQESADSLFKDANERLKTAIKNKDYEDMRVAQGMLEGTLALRKKARQQETKEDKLNKLVHKRQANLIESFFNKKPKT